MVHRTALYTIALFLLLPSIALPAADGHSPTPLAEPAAIGSHGVDHRVPQPSQPTTDGQLRAFWVDAWNDGFKTPAQIEQLIADAHTANANALFVQVRRRGDSYYNDSVEPRADDEALDPAPFDPLDTLIEAAHNADPPLQVHAWVVAFPVWAYQYKTTDPNRHVYYRHGCGDGCAWDDPDNWISYHYEDDGHLYPGLQLDPGHPDAAQYTVDVCLYLARHYEIDGLHLDYIRYDGSRYGYNMVSEQRFHAAYGGSGHPDPADETWRQWRRDQVTNVVRRIYLETTAVRPELIVSAATIAWGDGPNQTGWENSSAYRSVFQDWRSWLDEGILDLAIPMNYDREHNANQAAYFDHWIEWEKDHQYNRGVVVGQGSWLNYISGTLAQTDDVFTPSPAGNEALGICFYSYASTNYDGLPNSVFYQALSQPSPYGQPPFPTYVAPPTLPWKENTGLGHLMGWAIAPTGPLDGAAATLTGPINDTLISDANGFFGAVDLLPGSYTITLPPPATSPLYATVTAGQVSVATVAPPGADPTLRALLVDADHLGFKTPHQVDLLLADARAANLNTLIVQMRADGQTYYNSSIEPRSNDPDLAPAFDPLAYLLEAAHGGDPPLEIYAWLPTLAVWDQDPSLLPPGHVLREHPEWMTEDVAGNQTSYDVYHLDPGHPGVLTYTTALLLDLIAHYPVDGLLLDNLYYPYENSDVGNPIWGYNPTAVQRFHDRHGGSGTPAPTDPLWIAWRREQLTALLRHLYLRSTAARPTLRIAVSTVAWGDSPDQAGGWEQSSAYGRLLQDWRGWLQEGILDLAAPMNYDRQYDATQRAWYDHWLAWETSQAANRGILVLQGAYLNYVEHTLAQADQAPVNAVGFSSYLPSNLYADPEGNGRFVQPPRQPWYYTPQAEWWLWRALATPYGYTDPATGVYTATTPLFPSAVPTPTFDWKDTPTLGHAIGRAVGPDLAPLDGVLVTLSGPVSRSLRSDGAGFFAATDLPPGLYEAQVPGAAPGFNLLRGRVAAGQVAWLLPQLPFQTHLPLVPRSRPIGSMTGPGTAQEFPNPDDQGP